MMTKHTNNTDSTTDATMLKDTTTQQQQHPHTTALTSHLILLVAAFLFTTIASAYWPLIQLIQTSTDHTQRFDLIALTVAAFSTVYILVALMATMSGTALNDPQVSKIVASRCISTLHASIVVVSGILCVQSQHHSSWFNIQSLRVNTPSEQRIFEVSAGFFIVDIAVLLFKTRCRINNKESILLMCHHIITLYFMLTSGWYGHDGAIGIVGLIFAESTSPFVSMWTIARALKSKRHLAWTSPLFTVTFSFMRFVGMTISLIDGVPRWLFPSSALTSTSTVGSVAVANAVPYGIRVYWVMTYSLLCLGGWIWAKDAILGLRGYYKKQRQSRQQVQPMGSTNCSELEEQQMRSPFSPMMSRVPSRQPSMSSLELSK